ncbi:helix-turn-helix domain-containing protein [Leptolyngbya sp. FACHB-321]|uniref:helix-turn-helix domain-containing protein n=1 Tax=Leptolyngbya sp. FACHB-321 TaxID=2692807 RepID=UPI001688F3E4|nr:RodZ domain-containing protein [Leptolyngbya sp. FACHB-321]MBD2035735.1 helix-turn-helix domain-containing protein [Leptolyngbya sp. FACHB-321]
MSNQMTQISPEQIERLKELGAYLQQVRQKERISLETVAKKTLIPVRLLAALEIGNTKQLPEPVYIQGFIRRYADAIGIDGAELANAFPAQTDLRAPKPSWRGTVQAQLRPLHLYCLYTVLVVGAVSGLSYLLNRSSTPQIPGLVATAQKREPVITPVLPNGPVNIAAQPTVSPTAGNKTAQLPTVVSPKSVRIGLTMTSQSWVRIVVDGKTDFEGVLSEGTQRAWEADKQLVLRAGNAGGVMVSLNEGLPKPLGEPGAVEEVTFGSNAQAANLAASSESASLTASRPNPF